MLRRPDSSDLDSILDRVLAGEATPAESERLREWAVAHGARVNDVDALVRAVASPDCDPAAVRSGWERVAMRLNGTLNGDRQEIGWQKVRSTPSLGTPTLRGPFGLPTRVTPVRAMPKWLGMSRAVWATACGVGLSALVLVGAWHSGLRDVMRSVASWTDGRRPVAMTTYVTRGGQRAEITLPDGSTVILNVASRLDVPMNFAAGNRALRLNGEALFTVAHAQGTPFTVTTGGTTTRVLGTSFLIRHYATDTAAIIAVRTGRVAVQSTIVEAKQQVVIDARGVVHASAAISTQFGFTTGMLTLDGVPLRQAVVELNRWYDADIRVEDPALLNVRLWNTFPAGSLTDLSSMLEVLLGARVTRDGRTLTIYPR